MSPDRRSTIGVVREDVDTQLRDDPKPGGVEGRVLRAALARN